MESIPDLSQLSVEGLHDLIRQLFATVQTLSARVRELEGQLSKNSKNSSNPSDEEEIRAWCKRQIAYYKIPAHIRFVDSFPTTLSGKIQKYKICEFEIEARGLQYVASAATA